MVSVIIPTYNRARTIKDSINSVLAQTYDDFELIIVDDCSTDDTKEIVESIPDERISYYCLEKNSGACVARNFGMEKAKGDYIAFQDSDDLFLPNKLSAQLEVMIKNNADVSFCKLRRHFTDDDKIVSYFPDLNGSRFMTHEELCNGTYVSTQEIIAKKCVCDAVLFDPLVKKTQDYDWMIRASRGFSVYYYDCVLVDQFFQNDSISMSGWGTIKKTREYFLEKYKSEFVDNKNFEAFQLKAIIKASAILGERPIDAAKRLFVIQPCFSSFVKLVLTYLNLLKKYYQLKGTDGLIER